MSHAYGHPVYAEKLSGCPDMTPKEIAKAKAEFERDAEKAYAFFASTAILIPSEDL